MFETPSITEMPKKLEIKQPTQLDAPSPGRVAAYMVALQRF
jgi:hypothetical protein